MKWIIEFPYKFNFDISVIDKFIRSIRDTFRGFFDFVKDTLNVLLRGTETFLGFIPWWVYLILVFIIGWRIEKKISKGVLYCVLVALIGLFGLWSNMITTLSIVVSSVIISLLLGFPIGILVSKSDRANKTLRPILDTMQTMPIFVYLIPAMIFFGLGRVPAVIATTIYAIVPLIRLTNHGIRMVDTEVVEAAIAFGSTGTQTLIKVQIPQAIPTIMTGVNQTIMMAMSMVVTTSMIGAAGLGLEVLYGVQNMEIGRGLVAGSAVVVLAIILDRFTQGFVKKNKGVRDE